MTVQRYAKKFKLAEPENHKMDYVGRLLKLLQIQEFLSPDMQRTVNNNAKRFLDSMVPDTGKFLREDLDAEFHSEECVRILVQAVPSALSEKNEDGMIPIQCITWDYSDEGFKESALPFIPLLAEEGIKRNVGGEGMRGGLLCGDMDSDCVLQELACVHLTDRNQNKRVEARCIDIMNQLREKNLFFKNDIKDQGLILKACNPLSIQRFEYLADWSPESLAQSNDIEMSSSFLCTLMDEATWNHGLERFQLALEKVLQHHPIESGFLFQTENEEYDSPTILKKAYRCFGEQETWNVIQKCLQGGQSKRLIDRNLETNLYPFMALAADYKDSSELDFIYYLLRQNPVALQNTDHLPINMELKIPSVTGTKRKRI